MVKSSVNYYQRINATLKENRLNIRKSYGQDFDRFWKDFEYGLSIDFPHENGMDILRTYYKTQLIRTWEGKNPTTGKYSVKKYKCTVCGTIKDHGTNHWGEIYPKCFKCNTITTWCCLEPMPKGYEKPESWASVKLGDVCTVITKRTEVSR